MSTSSASDISGPSVEFTAVPVALSRKQPFHVCHLPEHHRPIASPHPCQPVSANPPAAPDARLIEAGRLFEQGRDEELGRLLEPLLAETEPHLEALFISGMLHAREGRDQDAADAFRRMLVRDPRLIRPRLELGQHHLSLELDTLNRKICWWSFSSRIVLGHKRRDSSIDLCEYKRNYVRVGLTRDF